MLFTRHDLWRIFRIVAVVTAVVLTLSPTSHRAVYAASFNPEINYQGKLSDNTGAAVDDDGYNMRFRLYDVATSGSPLWTEVWCYSPDSGATCNGTGTDQRVDVINGLFSVLLGDITSLSAVDFNDELWLEVSIGATGTSPTWEDLSPRKKLASVPAAFQADQLDGVDSLQFLRSDEADTMNASSSATLLTIDQDGSGDILNVVGGSTEYFTVLSSGNVGINNDTPGNQLSVGGDIGITTDSADLRFYQGSNYVGFQASSSLSGNQIWTLPEADGGTNQILATDGSGNLSWIDGSAATGSVAAYLDLTDTPSSFTASAIPFTNTGASALLHSTGLTFTDTDDILTVGSQRLFGFGTGNLFLGSGAGNTTLSGANHNLAIGANAGDALTTGDFNVFFGNDAGGKVTTGSSNMVIGYQAGLELLTGTNNAFIGVSAGRTVTTGDYNVLIGTEAGRNATDGNYNTFIGYKAGRETSSSGVNGDDNTFIGAWSGTANVTGRFNTLIGRNAGSSIVSDSSVTAIGYYAGSTASSTASFSTLIGNGAMRYGLGGTYNTVIGNDAGAYAAAGDNTFIGANAGFGVSGQSTGNQNVFIGRYAGETYQTTDRSVFIGYSAGENAATTTLNVIIGNLAGQNSSGDTNVFVGANAGRVTQSDGNVFVGFQAGTNNTTGYSNTYIGQDSGRNGTTADRNTFIGHDAGFNITTGNLNTFLGWAAGDANTQGISNVLLGANAGGGQTTANYNTLIGVNTGLSNTTGSSNVYLGYQAGLSATGSGNLFLGYQAGYSETGSNKLYIANSLTSDPLIYGEFDNGLVIVNGNLRIQDSDNEIWFGHTSNLNHQAAIGYERSANDGDLYFKTTTNTNDPIERMRITHDGKVGIGTSTPATLLDVYGDISVGGSNNELRFYEGANYVGFEAPVLSADQIWILPDADATSSGQALVSDGAGNLSWATVGGGGSSTFLGLSDTPGSFTANAIPFSNSSANALVYDNKFTFDATDDILTVGSTTIHSLYSGNLFIGEGVSTSSLVSTSTANVVVGTRAGASLTNGSVNTFVGYEAGYSTAGSDTNGAKNTFIGASAGYANTTGESNTYVGTWAGLNQTTGIHNTFLGQATGANWVEGSNNTILGRLAGYTRVAGSDNLFLGTNAGWESAATISASTLIGTSAGRLTAVDKNVFVGFESGYDATTGGDNTFLGYRSGYNVSTGASSTIIGFEAGYSATTGGNNVFLGYRAGYSETGSNKLYIENSSSASPLIYGEFDNDLLRINGNLELGGSNNELRFYEGANYVGFEAPALSANQIWVLPDADATSSGQVLTSDGAGNLSWTTPGSGGSSSYTGLSDTPGSFTASAIPFTNTGASALLHSTGLTFTDTDDILTIGASRFWDDGGTGIFIGQSAGNTSASGSGNVMVGQNGGTALTSGSNNLSLGVNAGSGLTSGGNNVLLGYQAGNTLTTGSANILIGYDVDVTSNSASNQLNIGNLVYGDLSAGQLSIGTSTLSHTLAVAGSFDVNSGAINYATSTNVTSIERLNLGNIEFEENAGLVSWFDLSVTSAAATGTVMGYVAQIDSNELLKLYAEADGSGGINTTRVVIGSASSAVLGSSNIPDGSLIVAGGALCVDDGSAANCDDAALTSGQIYAESTSVTAIDLAENFPTRDPSLEAAELVMLDPDNPVFVKTYDPADPEARLLGVVSTKPGVLLGGFGSERFQEERKVPVALAGRVPIKVILSETGAVKVGDRLTMSSAPGVATKAGAFDQTVGIALEPIEEGAEGVQEILVFVNLQNGGSEGAGGLVGLNDQLRAFGVQIGQEITRIARLIVGKLTVGTPQNPTGITIYDMNTRQPYCIKILNGQHVATAGACEEVDTTNFFTNTGGLESASSTDGGSAPASESGTGSGVSANDGGSSGTSNPPTETSGGTDSEAGNAPTTTDSGAGTTPTSTTSGTPTTTSSGAGAPAPTTTDSGAGSAPTTTDSGSTPPTSDPAPDSTPEPEPEPEAPSEPITPPAATPTSTPTTTS